MSSKHRVWRALARDARGRDLLLPWHPFSRTGYVLPDAARREQARRRIRRFVVGWGGAGIAVGYTAAWLGLPVLLSCAVIPLLVIDWAWWTRRFTRDLERIRYEPTG